MPKIENIVAVIVGAIVGVAIHKALEIADVEDRKLISEFSLRDVITLVIGFVFIYFGGRIHSYLRWMGLGIVAWQIGHEMTDIIWGAEVHL